ncbi:hypothetical protein FRZ06_13240 [Anoxybacterium hadale]|uniref:Uncharacterized protein n=1 Tax=Anoxybacterium hadale TaxID=3408580 RepID=A0ACD1ACM8_9FIRM|nr:hypothetical protein FRZ06_13240 [Clostridiales bacterium]
MKNMTLCGYNHNNELAPRMYMHERTFNHKLVNPDKFTCKELRRLFALLGNAKGVRRFHERNVCQDCIAELQER